MFLKGVIMASNSEIVKRSNRFVDRIGLKFGKLIILKLDKIIEKMEKEDHYGYVNVLVEKLHLFYGII